MVAFRFLLITRWIIDLIYTIYQLFLKFSDVRKLTSLPRRLPVNHLWSWSGGKGAAERMREFLFDSTVEQFTLWNMRFDYLSMCYYKCY